MSIMKNDHDPDHDPANDNSGTLVPGPSATMLTSFVALNAALNKVDTSGAGGYSGLPSLLFKSREGNDGTYVYGRQQVVPEAGSQWAANPLTLGRGWISFVGNKPTERMAPVFQDPPDFHSLPDTGADWKEQWSVHVKCVSAGPDHGVEAVFKATTKGTIPLVVGVVELVRDRLNAGNHNDAIVPIYVFEKDSYPHPQFGRIAIPVWRHVGWTTMAGPQPGPKPASPPPPPAPTPPAANSNTKAAAPGQPRRRRVG
jgi:hypothetical protein